MRESSVDRPSFHLPQRNLCGSPFVSFPNVDSGLRRNRKRLKLILPGRSLLAAGLFAKEHVRPTLSARERTEKISSRRRPRVMHEQVHNPGTARHICVATRRWSFFFFFICDRRRAMRLPLSSFLGICRASFRSTSQQASCSSQSPKIDIAVRSACCA